MEFSDYVESRPNAATLTGAEKVPMSQDGDAVEADINEIAAFVGDSAGVVQSVDGDGVDNTDPKNPVITIDPYSYPFPQFTTATSTTAYTGTPSPAITAYATGQKFQVKAHATSTGDATLNLAAIGAKKWFMDPTTQATTGDIVINKIYLVVYDATLDAAAGGFLMVSGGGSAGGGNVTKVGTPANDQLAVWTGDGTIEGDAALTFDTTTDKLSTVALNLSGLTASLPIRTDASKNLESRTVLQFLDDLGIDLTRRSCSVSAGTMTLDLLSKQQLKFEDTSTISSNFTIALSNSTVTEIFSLHLFLTGTIAITMPSSVLMETVDQRFVNGTKILTLIGVTASPFELSFTRINGDKFLCRASFAHPTS